MKRIKSYELFIKESRFPSDDEQVESESCTKCDCEDCTKCDCEKCNCAKCCADKEYDEIVKPNFNRRRVIDDEVVESNKKFEFFSFGKKKELSKIDKKVLDCLLNMNYDELIKIGNIESCLTDVRPEEIKKSLDNLIVNKYVNHYQEDDSYLPTKVAHEYMKNNNDPSIHRRKTTMSQAGIDVNKKPQHTYKTPGPKP